MSRASILALGALALLLVVSGLFVRNERTRANNAEIQAIEHKGRADLYAEQARSLEVEKKQATDRITNADAKVEALRTEVARLRKAASTDDPKPGPTPNDPGPEPQPVGPVVDINPLIAGLDSLVAAQEEAIKAREAKILVLNDEIDFWRKAHESRAAECIQLQAALAAQKGLAEGQLWKGRIQGFAVGVASGYVAGRLH